MRSSKMVEDQILYLNEQLTTLRNNRAAVAAVNTGAGLAVNQHLANAIVQAEYACDILADVAEKSGVTFTTYLDGGDMDGRANN